jgi:hypothetical protein
MMSTHKSARFVNKVIEASDIVVDETVAMCGVVRVIAFEGARLVGIGKRLARKAVRRTM